MEKQVKITLIKAGVQFEFFADANNIEETLGLVKKYDDLLKNKFDQPQKSQSGITATMDSILAPSKNSSQPPLLESKGKKLPELVLDLLLSEWGSEPRTAQDVVEALKLNAQYFNPPAVSTALIRLVQKGVLRRLKLGETYSYVVARK